MATQVSMSTSFKHFLLFHFLFPENLKNRRTRRSYRNPGSSREMYQKIPKISIPGTTCELVVFPEPLVHVNKSSLIRPR